MPYFNILIRGKPRTGKSTLVQKLIEFLTQRGKKLGGIRTPEIKENNRIGFEIIDVMTGRRGILAHINQQEGPKVSRYRVNLKDLNDVGVLCIRRALEENVDRIIIDEIGKMELVSQNFQDIVWEALNQQKVLGTIGQITHPFVSKIYQREDVKLIDLNIQNRDLKLQEVKGLLE